MIVFKSHTGMVLTSDGQRATLADGNGNSALLPEVIGVTLTEQRFIQRECKVMFADGVLSLSGPLSQDTLEAETEAS